MAMLAISHERVGIRQQANELNSQGGLVGTFDSVLPELRAQARAEFGAVDHHAHVLYANGSFSTMFALRSGPVETIANGQPTSSSSERR